MRRDGERARSLQGKMFQSVGSLSSILTVRSEKEPRDSSTEMIKSMGTLGSILTLTSRASSRVEVHILVIILSINITSRVDVFLPPSLPHNMF